MRWSYLFKHWGATLLLGPFMLLIQQFIYSAYFDLSGFIESYILLVGFSFLFSIPTFICCVILFNYLIDKEIGVKNAKLLIISTTVFGVFLSFLIIFGSVSLEFSIGYSVAAIISGMMFKLKKIETDETE